MITQCSNSDVKLILALLGAFRDPDLWSKEGPGRLLEQSQRMAELDALPARAKELAQRGVDDCAYGARESWVKHLFCLEFRRH